MENSKIKTKNTNEMNNIEKLFEFQEKSYKLPLNIPSGILAMDILPFQGLCVKSYLKIGCCPILMTLLFQGIDCQGNLSYRAFSLIQPANLQ